VSLDAHTAIHIHRVPTHVISERTNGERWCFDCRKRVPFMVTVHAPDDLMSYYGPHAVVACGPQGHVDGDCFPGTHREGGEW
jgi:hypothetical protein